MIEYRKAILADVPELVRLRIEFLREVMHAEDTGQGTEQGMAEYFTEYIPTGDYINWMALDGAVIVATGSICFYTFPPNLLNTTGRRAYILNVYTLPEYRRRGISKQIFTRLMQEAAVRDIVQISLHTSADGKALYEQFGFKIKDNEMVWGKHI